MEIRLSIQTQDGDPAGAELLGKSEECELRSCHRVSASCSWHGALVPRTVCIPTLKVHRRPAVNCIQCKSQSVLLGTSTQGMSIECVDLVARGMLCNSRTITHEENIIITYGRDWLQSGLIKYRPLKAAHFDPSCPGSVFLDRGAKSTQLNTQAT